MLKLQTSTKQKNKTEIADSLYELLLQFTLELSTVKYPHEGNCSFTNLLRKQNHMFILILPLLASEDSMTLFPKALLLWANVSTLTEDRLHRKKMTVLTGKKKCFVLFTQ